MESFYDAFMVLLHTFSLTKINHGLTTKKNKKIKKILSHDNHKVTGLTIVFLSKLWLYKW